jgi:hypothetical protein
MKGGNPFHVLIPKLLAKALIKNISLGDLDINSTQLILNIFTKVDTLVFRN